MNGKIKSIIKFAILIVTSLIMIYPLLWMIASSFKPEIMIFRDKSLIIRDFTFENYIRGFAGIGRMTFFDFLYNSLKVVIPVVIGTLLSCSMTGYAFARLSFFGRKVLFAIMMMTLMLPVHAALIPRYIMFNNIGWINTYYPLIVPNFFAVNAFFCFLFVQFIRGIPRELDQAATVDGCSPASIFIRIIIPLALPAFLTAGIFTFIWTYDDFFSQVIFVHSPRKFTMALALRQYVGTFELSAYGILFAMSAVSLVPVFAIFLSCQKYLIEGIATTGMKT